MILSKRHMRAVAAHNRRLDNNPQGNDMTAESVKAKQLNTSKQELIVAIKSDNPDMSQTDIAALADTSQSYVAEVLKRYNNTKLQVDDFKQYRADLLAGLQARLLSSITDDDIKKATLQSKLTGLGICYDKERIERGQSTGNQPILVIVKSGDSRPGDTAIDVTPSSQKVSQSVALPDLEQK